MIRLLKVLINAPMSHFRKCIFVTLLLIFYHNSSSLLDNNRILPKESLTCEAFTNFPTNFTFSPQPIGRGKDCSTDMKRRRKHCQLVLNRNVHMCLKKHTRYLLISTMKLAVIMNVKASPLLLLPTLQLTNVNYHVLKQLWLLKLLWEELLGV